MPRLRRTQYPGAWHHVMNRGAAKQATFRDPTDRREFLSAVAEMVERFRVEVHAYCLMGNHYHLLLRTPETNLDSAMQHLGGVYTQRFNRRHGRDGALFRGRYKSLLIESERYLLHVSRYIHRNPIELGVEHLADYAWSSYPSYAGHQPAPRWLRTARTLHLADGRTRYEAIVESPLDSWIDSVYRRRRIPTSIDSDLELRCA